MVVTLGLSKGTSSYFLIEATGKVKSIRFLGIDSTRNKHLQGVVAFARFSP